MLIWKLTIVDECEDTTLQSLKITFMPLKNCTKVLLTG